MTSLLTFLLTLNIVKKILIPVYGAEFHSVINHADPISMVDATSSNSFSLPEIIITEPLTESIEMDASLHDSVITVSIISLKCYNVHISAYFEDSFEVTRTFYEKQLDNIICYEHNGKINKEIMFKLPASLAYFDEQNLDNPTNFYVTTVEVYVSFVLHNGELHYDKLKVLPLLSPWFRKPRPRYNRNWELHLQNILKWKKIPTSSLTYDTNVFSSVVGLPAKEIGFTRKLKPLKWPSHAPQHVRRIFESDSKFTVTFWIFVNEYCPSGMCMIFQHRNASTYFTPLVLLNKEGGFHVQLHTKDGTGTAFTSGNNIPLKTWIFFLLAVDGSRAEMSLSFGGDTQALEYVHINHEPFYFNATHGLLSVGGYLGSISFSGFLGPVKLYRNIMMKIHYALKYTLATRQKLNQLDLSRYIENCYNLKAPIYRHVLGLSTVHGECPVQYWWHKKKPRIHPSVKKFREEIDGKVLSLYLLSKLKAAFKEKSTKGAVYSLKEYSKILYERTMKNLETQALANSVAARLFEISGCLGYPKGYYVSAVMHKYGLGVKVNLMKTHQMHLIAAERDYSLAHLALAYRHQLGIDGSPQDQSIVAGYLRNAAITAKAIMEREDQDVVTHSEMIRLDQVHLFRDVRGSNSQLVKWLTQQAKMGSGDARHKIAEIFYHGRQGAAVDRNQAREFYEMAAADNDVAALFNLGVIHLKGINVKKNETKAFEFFKKAAEHNNSIAFNSMAFVEFVHHHNRSGAVYYWKKAADLDDGDGLNNYAQMLEAGLKEGDPQNHTEAYKYYVKAASKGQKNGCIKVGDYMIAGIYTERQVTKAAEFYRFVADQLNDVGICLREAINAYADGMWYMSLIHHLLVNEAGIQLGGYNTALLLKEYQGYVEDVVEISDPYYFYNLTAEQGWSLSLLEMGHRNWYNKSSKKNLMKASQYYARSIEKDNNPEALFNLGYIVEYGYPMHEGIQVNKVKDIAVTNRNLSIASQLYQSCIDSEAESKEGYYPCQMALLRIKMKIYFQQHPNILYYPVALLPIVVASILTYIKIR